MYGKSKEAAEGPVASLLCSGVFCGLVAQPSEDAGLAALCASVAVAITVAGAVVAAVAAGVFLDIVEHDAEVFETVLLVHTFQLGQEVALLHSGPDDEEGDVHHAVDDSGIGHGEHRGAVDDDLVILFAQLAHEFVEPVAHQQFGGVGGKHRDAITENDVVVLHDDVLHFREVVGKVGGEAHVVSEVCAEGAFADVGVDEERALAHHGKGDADVARDEALALPGGGRRGHDDLGGVAYVIEAEAHDAESLYQGRVVGQFVDEGLAGGGLHVGYFAEQGDGGGVFNARQQPAMELQR